ncbi:type ISP restriction/modification enzyme [Sediminitomix flava]|uniref:Type ISP restriction-modification enzyme LLaBIII C-terminal specificity domain-containing protein n=1 Tax=Sediminitomix flava TaxID=379075 RepID=A0A315ZII6_SEDFL|nr:type ISP restriction/modification enzyme [Sediminitomix flava]PWJ45019.1 hypothetical protein BC781_1011417 [Sediminitomix flava]
MSTIVSKEAKQFLQSLKKYDKLLKTAILDRLEGAFQEKWANDSIYFQSILRQILSDQLENELVADLLSQHLILTSCLELSEAETLERDYIYVFFNEFQAHFSFKEDPQLDGYIRLWQHECLAAISAGSNIQQLLRQYFLPRLYNCDSPSWNTGFIKAQPCISGFRPNLASKWNYSYKFPIAIAPDMVYTENLSFYYLQKVFGHKPVSFGNILYAPAIYQMEAQALLFKETPQVQNFYDLLNQSKDELFISAIPSRYKPASNEVKEEEAKEKAGAVLRKNSVAQLILWGKSHLTPQGTLHILSDDKLASMNSWKKLRLHLQKSFSYIFIQEIAVEEGDTPLYLYSFTSQTQSLGQGIYYASLQDDTFIRVMAKADNWMDQEISTDENQLLLYSENGNGVFKYFYEGLQPKQEAWFTDFSPEVLRKKVAFYIRKEQEAQKSDPVLLAEQEASIQSRIASAQLLPLQVKPFIKKYLYLAPKVQKKPVEELKPFLIKDNPFICTSIEQQKLSVTASKALPHAKMFGSNKMSAFAMYAFDGVNKVDFNISDFAFERFFDRYGKNLEKHKQESDLSEEALEQLIETATVLDKLTKNLPVLNKYVQRLFEDPSEKEQYISFIKDTIKTMEAKVRQLSRGANERRKLLFEIAQHTSRLSKLLYQVDKKSVENSQKLEMLNKEHIFYYTYAVLCYQAKYENEKALASGNIPVIPFKKDFWHWANLGKELLKLDTLSGIAAYPLQSENIENPPNRQKKYLLDEAEGKMYLNGELMISGIPPEGFAFGFGKEKVLEAIADAFFEKKPRDKDLAQNFPPADFKKYLPTILMTIKQWCQAAGMKKQLFEQIAQTAQEEAKEVNNEEMSI